MSFKEKILSKSNSYNHYKGQNEKLLEKIDSLEEERDSLKEKIAELENELNFFRNDETLSIKKKYSNFKSAGSFCSWDYMPYYLRDDYEDKVKEVTKHLPEHAQKIFKWYVLRAMVVNMIKKDSLYFNYELKDQKEFTEFKLNNETPDGIAGYKFTGEYNLHPFIRSRLTMNDIHYIKDKNIIDAGAFTGDTSLPLSKITKKQVYAFEPFKDSFDLLKKNIEDNEITNIVPINKSLGNINGERTLFLSGNNIQGITSDSEIREFTREIKVEETTIDTFVEENNLEIGYIAIDVEGAEMDLLEGAINTIKTQKPILAISMYHKVSDYFDIIPWVANLDLGYEFNIIKENPWTFIADTVVQCRMKY